MADKKFDLVFNASMEVGQVKTAMASLTKSLENAGAKIPQSMGNNLNRMIQNLNTEINKLEGMTDIQLDSKNAKNVIKSYDKIFQIFQQIKIALGDIQNTAKVDPEKFFPTEVAQNIKKAKQAIADYKKSTQAGNKSEDYAKAVKDVSEAEKKLKTLRDKLDEAGRKRWVSTLTKDNLENTRKDLLDAKEKAEQEHKAAQEAKKDIDDRIKAQKRLAAVEAELAEKRKKQKEAEANKNKNENEKKARENRGNVKKGGTDNQAYQKVVAEYQKNIAEVQKLQNEINTLENEYNQLRQIAPVSMEEAESATKRAEEALTELTNAQKRLNQNQKDIDTQDAKNIAATAEVQTLIPDIQKTQQELQNLIQTRDQLDASFEKQLFNVLIQELAKVGIKLPVFEQNINGAERAVENMSETAKQSVQSFGNVETAVEGMNDAINEVGHKAGSFDGLSKEVSRAEQDIENLKNQVLDFFSITNTIQIFKDAIHDAFDTVKELDAAMTETAVVTDFSIGDMWNKLPEYSKEASKLGVSITDLYNATTLYYQQGLKGAEVMNIGVETMKMARIAGMDGAEATEAMTAALRGFNMEINEMSATRINDVYSELAAVTASDTSQIATAMSKTASIAASANMEFETTAALLAQIIETTQEAPETAGTAMKTIIARFTEVKKLFSEGMLTGEDSEGEEIDINKIDAALKTVGISLKDFLTGSKGIDDIFLELSSKWNTLDLATQRYIATIAAGSRQQSRFLAMMSNYDRTMELVTAANNSAGASQKQFDKTSESLEAKLQRLENAWHTFVMGLSDSDLIKGGVDLLTKILEIVNNLTNATKLLGNNVLGKTLTVLLRLGTVLAGLKSGEAAMNGLIKFLANSGVAEILGLKVEKESKIDFFAAFKKSAKGLKGTLSKLKENFSSALGLLKDPTWRGEALTKLKVGFKNLGKDVILPFVKSWGIWIALLGAAIALIKKFIEIHNAAQKSAKMEAAQESMRALAEETEAAKNELNTIADSKKNLDSMTDTLNNLTKGTDEWKQSLIAVNQEVLKLIEEYPELAGYVVTGENGQLSIEEAGWDKIYADQMNLITNLNGLQSVIAAQIKELQAGIDFDNFVINTQDTAAEKWTAEKELEIADTFDTKVGKKGNLTVGDLVAATNDGMTLSGDSGAAAGQAIAALINQWLGNPSPKTMSQINQEVKNQGGYAANTQRNRTGGLTQEEYTDFAAALVEAGVYLGDKDGLSETDKIRAQKIYSDFGFNADFFDSVMTAAQEVGQDFDELGSKALSLSMQEEQAAKNFVRNATNSAEDLAGLEYGDAITEFLAGAKNYDNLTEEIEKEKQKILTENTTNQLLEKYAAMYGKYYADGKLYTDSSMANEIQGLSDDFLANAIASANITVQVRQDALDIVQNGLKGANTELFDDLFSADGSQISSEQVVKYQQGEELDVNQIAVDIGYDNLEDMASKLGTSVENLSYTLAQNFEKANERIVAQRKDLVKQMSKYSSKDLEGFEANAGILANLELKFGEQIRYILENVFESLGDTGDDVLISKGYEYFRNIATTGTLEDVKELSSYIESIDWSNPIETAYTLNQEIQNGSGLAKDFAQEMMAVESSFLGAGNQMQYFLKSNDFKDMKENLSEIIEQNGEIAASDIIGLADDYKSLNKILKNTEATASGLAKTLQLVAEGELGIHQLTNAVMAALEGFDSVDSLVAETLKTLSDFDPGIDENEVGDFVNTAYETISANLKAGAVGNNQNFSYLDFMFPGWREGLSGDELVAQMEYLTGKLEENSVNMRKAWSDLDAGKDIYGNAWEFDAGSGRTAEDLKIEDTGSEILLTGWEGKNMTTQDMVDWIADAYNVSENYAKMMLADFKNYSADLAQELNKNDYTAGLGKAYENLKTISVSDVGTQQLVDKKIIDESEIEAIAILYNKKISEVRQDFENQGALITDFFDENGMLQETSVILEQLDIIAQSGGADGAKWVDNFIRTTEDGFSSLNVNELNSALGKIGIPEESKNKITQDIVNSMMAAENEAVYIDAILSDGSVKTLEITPQIDVATAIANAETDLANSKLAESIKQAFSNITIDPQVNTKNLTGYIISAIKAADGTVVTMVPDQESLNTLTDKIKGAVSDSSPVAYVNGNVQDVIDEIANLKLSAECVVTYVEGNTPPGKIDNNTNTNGIKPRAASGIKKANYSGETLVSEEGPELIQKANGGAYLSGTSGPEMVNIEKGDTVYTAKETEDIFKKRNHNEFPRYASGRYASGYGEGTAYQGTGGSGGKGSKNSDDEDWENSFDKLYNLVREIDEELRQRERLERRYEKLLESVDLTAGKLFDNSVEQLKQLEKEKLLNKELQEARRAQIQQYQQENADLMKYAKIVQNERGEDVLRIHWDQINLVEDPEQGQRIEDYVSQLEEWYDSLEEVEDNLNDIEDRIEEIKELGKEEYLDLEKAIKDAVTSSYQEEIDKLSEINESINDTNTQLIDAISKQVSRIRQQRENERTEQELQEKQRQLLYLSQDTSGANDMAILELQREIEEETVDYTDTLIDQKIDELQTQNDEAAQQREQQITLMQAQLDHLIQSGEIWDEVYSLMDEGLDQETGLVRGSRLEQILKNAEGFQGMSKVQQMDWLKELQQQAAQAVVYMRLTTEKIDTAVELNRQNHFGATTPEPEYNGSSSGGSGGSSGGGGSYGGSGGTVNKTPKSYQASYNYGGWSGSVSSATETEARNEITRQIEAKYKAEINRIDNLTGVLFSEKTEMKNSAQNKKNKALQSVKVVAQYKKGGLADFTGPAWLDGTKSRPELVLNQKDTQNFIQLKNILASLMTGSRAFTENNGDITYDIDINIESIGSDYDVEQVANKVKSLINENARYRNNNAISLKR